MVMALTDGRALTASTLSAEAGIARSTTSEHLGHLVDSGFVRMEPHGRHRYYRLAGPHVAGLVESLARLAPPLEVRSLREGTKAHALRVARTCYDHLAGRLGVSLMRAFLSEKILEGGDGEFRAAHSERDRPSAPGWDVAYVLTDHGRERMDVFGLDLSTAGRRPLVRYCVDWSEQRHHLGGALGAALLERMEALRWLRRAHGSRALVVTDAGRDGLASTFGLFQDD